MENLKTTRIQTIIRSAESKKAVINEFLKAWVVIPAADTLRRKYLPDIFEKHLQALHTEFKEKPIAIIIDEATDSQAHSVVNTLFSYCNSSKLVSVD
ncbi:8145_t:CDS:2 [Ambispora gerdemannii]|uniref:8145_t:CDS:1 n=1 Tax=Ambispora gerdemannii TaxID=144530 RepID=A0A9N9D9W8_9GLOM|nr:8145_t:CDS:2 [Ambispora gerdemannii]